MVSKAKEDLPLPLTPVNTTNLFLGMAMSMFFRLCSRAPKTSMKSSLRLSISIDEISMLGFCLFVACFIGFISFIALAIIFYCGAKSTNKRRKERLRMCYYQILVCFFDNL